MYRQITALNPKIWFLCLMAFVISWSGVSYAFVGSNHMNGSLSSVQNLQNSPQHSQHLPINRGMRPCHDLHPVAQKDLKSDHFTYHDQLKVQQLTVQHSAGHSKTHSFSEHAQDPHTQQQVKATHCQQDQADHPASIYSSDSNPSVHQQHGQCHDCSQLHCQSISSSLDTSAVGIIQALFTSEMHSQNSTYTAQHLSGYWQKILRPPKA